MGPGQRGRAYGWYHGAVGLGALPAGLLTGWLWEASGSRAALLACAGFAAAAALGMAASRSLRGPPGEGGGPVAGRASRSLAD